MDIFIGIIVLAVLLAVYFLPTLMAFGKRNLAGILFLNLTLGWTVAVWVVCFIWACVSPEEG